MEFSTWLHVGDVRNFCGDAIEVFKIQFNASFIGNRQQVQHCVRTSTQSVCQRNRIFECLLRENVARANSESQHIHDSFSGETCIHFTTGINCRRRSRAWQRQSKCLTNGRHRVSGKHSATCTFTGARVTFNFAQLFFGDRSGSTGANCFKHRGDVESFSIEITRHR